MKKIQICLLATVVCLLGLGVFNTLSISKLKDGLERHERGHTPWYQHPDLDNHDGNHVWCINIFSPNDENNLDKFLVVYDDGKGCTWKFYVDSLDQIKPFPQDMAYPPEWKYGELAWWIWKLDKEGKLVWEEAKETNEASQRLN